MDNTNPESIQDIGTGWQKFPDRPTSDIPDLSDVQSSDGFGFWALIKSDLNRFVMHSARLAGLEKPTSQMIWNSILFKAGFQAAVLYRLSHWFFKKRWIFMARVCMRLSLTLTGADIGFAAEIGPGLLMSHPVGVVIAHKTVIGANASIFQGVVFGVKDWLPDTMQFLPRVGNHCVFCAHCMILGDAKVGHHCVIAANTIITGCLSEGVYAYGNPVVIEPDKGRKMITSWCL